MCKVLIAGDFCPQNRVSDLFDNDEFESVLGEVKHYTSDSDYSIVNLECPVTNGNESPISKIGPNLGYSEKGIEALKWAGFNCVTLANNHLCDYGDEGVKNTIEACKENAIDVVGGGMKLSEASRILYKVINGRKLAIINCCEHEFSIATEKSAGANPFNPIHQFYAIKEAKANADCVIVIIHGGHEHYQLPSPRMVKAYRFFVDAGADAIINHHQHCFSGYEIYNEKPIFYGLGNFCFDGNRSRKETWHEGYMVLLKIDEKIDYEIIPYKQCKEKPIVDILDNDAYCERIEELNKIIVSSEKLKQKTDVYYAKSANGISNFLEPFRNKYYKAAKARGWLPSFISKKRKLEAANFILCEAHRDKLSFWLEYNK